MLYISIPHHGQQENKTLLLEVIEDFCKILKPKALYWGGYNDFDSIEEIRKILTPNEFVPFIRDENGKLMKINLTPQITEIINKHKK